MCSHITYSSLMARAAAQSIADGIRTAFGISSGKPRTEWAFTFKTVSRMDAAAERPGMGLPRVLNVNSLSGQKGFPSLFPKKEKLCLL